MCWGKQLARPIGSLASSQGTGSTSCYQAEGCRKPAPMGCCGIFEGILSAGRDPTGSNQRQKKSPSFPVRFAQFSLPLITPGGIKINLNFLENSSKYNKTFAAIANAFQMAKITQTNNQQFEKPLFFLFYDE